MSALEPKPPECPLHDRPMIAKHTKPDESFGGRVVTRFFCPFCTITIDRPRIDEEL